MVARIENLNGITGTQRRLIERSLRLIASGNRTLSMLADAAATSVHRKDHEALEEIEQVFAGIRTLQEQADEIGRQIEWHPGL